MIGRGSSKSSDGVITIDRSVLSILVVDALPLEVLVVHDVGVAMDHWLHHVHKEKHWHHWKHQSHVVTRQTYVQNSVSFKGTKRVVPPRVSRRRSKWVLLLS